jgi:hypothetical protein
MEKRGISTTLLDEQRHGVFIGGEELQQRLDAKFERQFFNRALMSSQHSPVHVDAVPRVVAFHNDVHGCRHGEECNAFLKKIEVLGRSSGDPWVDAPPTEHGLPWLNKLHA